LRFCITLSLNGDVEHNAALIRGTPMALLRSCVAL
jgi:hypothetical protein